MAVPVASSSLRSVDEEERKAFPYPLPKDQGQQALSSIPLPMFYPALLAFVGAAGLAGKLVGSALPVEEENQEVASYATAAVAVAGAAYASVQAKKKRDSAAVVDLYNLIVDLPEPTDLTSDMVSEVGRSYGITMQKDDLEGLCKIYGQFLESVIPSGDTQLRGGEAEQVRAFKEALGLSDEDAAPVHVEVARRLFRQGYETGDRNQQFEQRKAFSRLIYLSTLVFGEQKAAFLLPWRRHFNLTDAQLFVARRDNAKAIFKRYMEARGGDLVAERHVLRELRDKQQEVKLLDETAEELVREYARRHVEQRLSRALEAVRGAGKSKDMNVVVSEVTEVLAYSRTLAQYANEEDLIPGLGKVSVTGGPLGDGTKTRDLKDLFRGYLEEQLQRTGSFTEALEADAHDLAAVLAMPQRDAQALQDEVAARLYRRLLREEVVSRRIDEASSPAAVLQQLCERVRFSPEAALELHRQLYKQKLTSFLDRKKITDQENEDLKRIRRILCLPPDVAKKASRETAGKVLEETLSDIFLMGAKPVSDADKQRVEECMRDMRLEEDVAMEVFQQATRDRLKLYLQTAQKERNDRKAAAAAIKKMITFNALVVTPLLEAIKGTEKAKKELAEIMAKAMEQAKAEGASPEELGQIANEVTEKSREEQLKSVAKSIQATRGDYADEERKGQKDINLREDVDAGVRSEIYKNYLMHTMMGEVVELPVGGTIRKKQNPQARQAEMTRLQSLSDLLGMTQMEVAQVHQDLAGQAFKAQASEVLKTGPMTEEKSKYLEDLRTQMGMSKEAADKELKAARTELFGASAASLEDGGRWTLDRAMEVAKAGGSIDGLVEEPMRRNIFRRELEKRITDGTGSLDPEFMLKEVPRVLALEQRKVDMVLKELVATRKRMLLVQAVSTWRQKRVTEVITSLNNLVSCSRALPDEKPMAWSEREELREVFAAFCQKESDEAKQSQLALVLGFGAEEAADLRANGSAGAKKDAAKKPEEEEAFF